MSISKTTPKESALKEQRKLNVVTEAHQPLKASMDFAAEGDLSRCGALKDFWYVACLAEELKDKPIARTLFNTSFVLFRDENGKPRALRDRCLHRNAPLSEGVVIGGKLACPYHGWMYDAEGRVVQVPAAGPSGKVRMLDDEGTPQADESPTAKLGCVPSFPTREQDGLIYLLPSGDERTARKPPFAVPYWDDPAWRVYFMVTDFDNGVTNLVENFMDVPHTIYVHSGWFRKEKNQHIPARVERTDGSVSVTYKQGDDKISGLGRLLNPRGEAMVHTDKFFSPNITRVDYGFGKTGFVINSQCTPVSAMKSKVFTAIGYRLSFDLPGNLVARLFEPLIHWYTRQVIQQDVDIMKLQGDVLRDVASPTFQSTQADILHTDIEAYRAWLVAGATGQGPADASRDFEFWI